MGKHILLLLLGLSLLVSSLQDKILADDCGMLNSDGICEKGNSTCKAKMTRNVANW
ncbi:rCG64168 [Rattus norvegicus]|uniref:RCG64168 n=1 Tax=Rattus norvegicus TaxID=10116 RepID=A6JYL8_RAT|nr:rCG64168 [Rattus norvegicus]